MSSGGSYNKLVFFSVALGFQYICDEDKAHIEDMNLVFIGDLLESLPNIPLVVDIPTSLHVFFKVRLLRLQPDGAEFDAIFYRCQSFFAGDF